MGFLQSFTSAASAATASSGLSMLSSGLSAIGDITSGIGQNQMAGFQAQIASNNAAIERQNAAASLQAGQMSEMQSKLRTGLLIGEQKAAQGANGFDVNMGSNAQVRQSTSDIGAMDAALIHYNAARTAFGQQMEANVQEAQSALDKKAGQNAIWSGLFKAGTTLISGASSLARQKATFALSQPAG